MDETRRELVALTARPLAAAIDVRELDPDALDDDARDAARIVWARRVANESASIVAAERLVPPSHVLGLDAEVRAALARLEHDERLHAELATAVAERLGPPFAPR